jgi:hypothetical protein
MAPPNNRQQRTRRTVKACVICHKKKVRCDIDEVEGDRCTPCVRDNYQCVPRERKRKRFTLTPSPPPTERRTKQRNNELPIPEDGQALPHNLKITNVEGTAKDSLNFRHLGNDPDLKSEVEHPRRLSSTAGLDSVPSLEGHSDPAYSAIHQIMNSDTAESAYQPSNSVSYLGRLEYLRNDVPVSDDAGLPNKAPHRLSTTDMDLLQVQRVADLPPMHVRESLMEAFWARCYPWTPIVQRSWVDNRDPRQISLLLQHAIFLAGSRVSPPLQNYPPEEFYKKAKLLFWTSAETDPIIMIASACLLHWWNPEGPERVSLDTSGFWLRACVGLAYQVGLHREPNGKADAGLRRRLWWSLVVRDCLINAGHGRPRAIDLKLADVSPTSVLDFDGAAAPADLFSAYVGISCILGKCGELCVSEEDLANPESDCYCRRPYTELPAKTRAPRAQTVPRRQTVQMAQNPSGQSATLQAHRRTTFEIVQF